MPGDSVSPPTVNQQLRHLAALLGQRLLAGVALALPLLVTYWVLSFGYRLVDGLSKPWLRTLGLDFPGLGFVFTLLVFLALGLMATHVLGRRLLDRFEAVLLRVPLVSSVYAGTRQLITSLRDMGEGTKLRRVVTIEYLVPGSCLFGFATGSFIEAGTGRPMTTVFVPTAPNPTTGLIFAFPTELVRECDLSMEEVTKLLFSGGLVTPARPVATGARAPDQTTV